MSNCAHTNKLIAIAIFSKKNDHFSVSLLKITKKLLNLIIKFIFNECINIYIYNCGVQLK